MRNTVQKNLTDTVRNMSVWRNPEANIDSDDFIDYGSREKTLSRFWPETLGFQEFLETSASEILEKNVKGFYKKLEEEAYILEQDMTQQIEGFEKAYKSFYDSLRGFVEKKTVKETLLL